MFTFEQIDATAKRIYCAEGGTPETWAAADEWDRNHYRHKAEATLVASEIEEGDVAGEWVDWPTTLDRAYPQEATDA